jgi:hypothetical protein
MDKFKIEQIVKAFNETPASKIIVGQVREASMVETF